MGCFTFIKVMMILFNLAIFLGGGALLGVGIWVTVDGQSFLKIFGTLSSSVLQVVNVSYFLIVIGAILVIIGFLGCYGAQKESKCLLMMFFSVVLIIFIAEIAAAVVVLVYTSLVSGLAGSWAGTFWDSSNPFRKTGGLVLLPVGWKDGTPNSGAGSVGGQGQPGWVEGLPEVQATRRGSHCPKETSIIIQVLPTACF